jgi:hypothetical protein
MRFGHLGVKASFAKAGVAGSHPAGGTTLTSANAGLRTGLPIPYSLAHLRTGADSLAENRTQIVGLSVGLAANTPTVVATEVVISSDAGI